MKKLVFLFSVLFAAFMLSQGFTSADALSPNTKVVFVSVSLDIDEASWKAAIEEDELVWKDHFCDFKKYDSPMALKYGVTTLPKFIVFNASGKQVYSANTTHELEANVSSLLK